MIPSLSARFFTPVDIASLVVFRIIFGGIMIWEVCRYFHYDWIRRYYIDPTFFFTYYGFSWVRPWPGHLMYVHFYLLGVLAFLITIGLFYRVSAALFFLGFTYVFLLDQANYLNHFYFISLMSFLMILVPAHRAFSLDACLRPQIRTQFIPAWCLWLLRAQLAVVYIGAGVAKINADYFQGEPMRMWLASRSDFALGTWKIGELFTKEWVVWFFSYGGLLFDLLIVPALLWRRTRIVAFIAVAFFHLMNAFLFNIGIFPWISLGATIVLFLPADWPRRAWRRPAESTQIIEPLALLPIPPKRRAIIAFLCVHMTVQILVPLRHLLYSGIVHWTEEGHRFSWHMKLRDKEAEGRYWATDPRNSSVEEIYPANYLTSRQRNKMMKTPDMILQFAHHAAQEMRRSKNREVEIHADIEVSLNGRPYQKLIDPTVNLAAQKRTLGHAAWILPLETPLRKANP